MHEFDACAVSKILAEKLEHTASQQEQIEALLAHRAQLCARLTEVTSALAQLRAEAVALEEQGMAAYDARDAVRGLGVQPRVRAGSELGELDEGEADDIRVAQLCASLRELSSEGTAAADWLCELDDAAELSSEAVDAAVAAALGADEQAKAQRAAVQHLAAQLAVAGVDLGSESDGEAAPHASRPSSTASDRSKLPAAQAELAAQRSEHEAARAATSCAQDGLVQLAAGVQALIADCVPELAHSPSLVHLLEDVASQRISPSTLLSALGALDMTAGACTPTQPQQRPPGIAGKPADEPAVPVFKRSGRAFTAARSSS